LWPRSNPSPQIRFPTASASCRAASERTGCEVIPGDYEQCVLRFLSGRLERDRNYFFYVDPYGVKSLEFDHCARLKQVGFHSLEMLINLNSTGFLREGCRLLKLGRAVPDWADDADYDTDISAADGHPGMGRKQRQHSGRL